MKTNSVGAIVPASTFMYGSILIEVTCIDRQPGFQGGETRGIHIFNPIVLSSRPAEEAVPSPSAI